MNLSRRNFMKIAGLSAAAVAGAALFTGCSGSGEQGGTCNSSRCRPVHRLLRLRSAHAARPVFCYRDR